MELYNKLQKYVPPSWASGALSYQPESYVQVLIKELPNCFALATSMNPTHATPTLVCHYRGLGLRLYTFIAKLTPPYVLIQIHLFQLALRPTPIHHWDLPGVPKEFQVFIKRDDMTGSTLGGNKVH